MLHQDNFGNTVLHLAAMGNYSEVLVDVLRSHEAAVRECFVNITPVFDGNFRAMLRSIYHEMIAARFLENEPPHFPKAWFYDATKLAYNKLSAMNLPRIPFPPPEKFMADFILDRYHDDGAEESIYTRPIANGHVRVPIIPDAIKVAVRHVGLSDASHCNF